MPDIIQDKYILGQSQSGTVAAVGQEIRLDLQLQPNTSTLTGGNISGTVKNPDGTPIENALVKIMDANYAPLMHDITDATGTYSFTNVPANQTYNIFAIASGKTLNQGNQFTVSNYQDLTINFTLTPDSAMSLGVIAGDLVDQSNNQPINGAVVSLYLNNPDGSQTIQAITYTNQYGQYTFREVPQGNYSVEINALGYNSTTANITVNQTGQLVPMTVTMVQNPNTSRGTVSGIITDNNNQPISRADVILYRVNADNSLTPVAFTKTTTSGIYLFGNVDPGNYKVKSNQGEVVNINVPSPTKYAPKFSGFELFYTQNYYIGEYSAPAGTLAGGASIEPGSGFVQGLGTGSVTLNVNAPSSGNYYLAVEYLAAVDQILSIAINNGSPKNVLFYQTPTVNVSDAKTRYISVPLTAGQNSVKFYNAFQLLSPNIKTVTLLTLPYSYTTNIAQGVLENGATANPNNFVNNLGGASNGSVTFTVNAPINGSYVLRIPYINTSAGPLTMKISVDGGTAISSSFIVTPNGIYADAISAAVSIGTLTSGSHTIKFYNDTGDATIVPGPTDLLLTFPLITAVSKNGTLANGATVDGATQYVSNLGGSNNGAVTLSVNAVTAGLYSLGVQYINGSNMDSNMKISINNATGVNYVFPETASNNASSAQIYYVNVTLIAGANTIKFYNDTNATTQSPWINNIYLQGILMDIPYTVTNSNIALQNGANVQNGLITNIGTNLGFITLSYPAIPLTGKYTLNVGYVTTLANRVCSLDINGTSTGIQYNFTPTASENVGDSVIKSIPVNLTAGANTIKIYTN